MAIDTTSPAIPTQSAACVLCGKVLSSNSSLKRHLTTVHQLSPAQPAVEETPVAVAVLPAHDDLPPTEAQITTAPARKRRGLILLGALGVVVAAGLGVSKATGGGGGAPTITLHGSQALMQDTGMYSSRNYSTYSGTCEGTGGYNDMAEGAEVTIHDAQNTVIATGHLNAGSDEGGMCVFTWSIPDVPVQKFYGVQVTHRGTITFTAQDAEGSLDTSLGR